MKKVISAIALLLCISIGLSAQRSIRWVNNDYNFGAFKEDSGHVTCQFKGVNVGDEPVSIVSARATCGCTTPEYSRKTFAPGDTITVTVSYDPEGRPGRFMKKVYLKNSNDDGQDELKIRGVVIGSEETLKSRYPIDCGKLRMQQDVVAIGELPRGKAKAVFVNVYNQTTDTVVPQLKNVPSYIKTSITPAKVAPGEQASLAFHFDAFYCEKWGVVNDSVTLVTDAQGGQEVIIDVTANVVPNFAKMTPGERMNAPVVAFETERIDMGVVSRQGEPITREFKIKNQGKDEMKIYRAYSLDEGVSVKLDKSKIKGGKTTKVVLTIVPSQLKGELLNATIRFVVNAPSNPQPVMRVVGELK
jgi:hypothetical protein